MITVMWRYLDEIAGVVGVSCFFLSSQVMVGWMGSDISTHTYIPSMVMGGVSVDNHAFFSPSYC